MMGSVSAGMGAISMVTAAQTRVPQARAKMSKARDFIKTALWFRRRFSWVLWTSGPGLPQRKALLRADLALDGIPSRAYTRPMRRAACFAVALSIVSAARADDISDHYEKIERMMIGEKARITAQLAEARRLEAQRPNGAPVFTADASCPSPRSLGLWGDEVKTLRTDAAAVQAQGLMDDMLARIILANNLSVPSLCGVAAYQQDYLNSTALERALPDGKPIRAIVISSGLLVRLENDSQLAFVLSHELAHFVLKHALSRPGMKKIALATRAMSDVDDTMPDVRHVIRNASGFSREHEAEADEFGEIFMHRAGYDVAKVPRVFELFQRYNTDAAGGLLAGHPDTDARVKSSLQASAQLADAPVVAAPLRHLKQIQRLLAQHP